MEKLNFSIRINFITNYLNTDFPTIPQTAPTKGYNKLVKYSVSGVWRPRNLC